jgi:hypothetical protein
MNGMKDGRFEMNGSRWISASFPTNVNRLLKDLQNTEFCETAEEASAASHICCWLHRESGQTPATGDRDTGKCEKSVQ